MKLAEKIVGELLETEGSDYVKSELERLEIGHRVCISYSKYKFDDDGSGNYQDEHGWEDEMGVDMEPDEFDVEAGTTAVSKAVNLLLEEGAVEPSNSPFSPGTWYATEASQPDDDGWYTERHFHLKGYTEEEQEQVYNAIRPPRR